MAKARQTKLILLIDDNEMNRLVTRRILEGAGYGVIEASGVEAGLALAMQQAPHLIILDLVMPDATGFDFLDTRARFPELKTLPVLVLSGLDDKDSVYRAMALGASDYLNKPVGAKILLQKVLKAIQSQEHLSVKFDPAEAPKVQVGLSAKIIMGSESGFILETPAKLGEEVNVAIQSPLLDRLECSEVLFKRTTTAPKIGSENLYMNEVSGIGMSGQSIARIRKILQERK